MIKIYKKYHLLKPTNDLYLTSEVRHGAWRGSGEGQKRHILARLWYGWEGLIGTLITKRLSLLKTVFNKETPEVRNSICLTLRRPSKSVILKETGGTTGKTMNIIWEAIVARKIMIVSIITLIIVIPIAYLTLRYGGKIEAAWYDDNFAYRQRVDITNSGTAQTDYQVAITLNTSTLITAGKMQSDCDDIRITDANPVREISYQVQQGLSDYKGFNNLFSNGVNAIATFDVGKVLEHCIDINYKLKSTI